MILTDDDIHTLLQRLHYQAREHGPYFGLPLNGENNAQAAMELRTIVRAWLAQIVPTQETQR